MTTVDGRNPEAEEQLMSAARTLQQIRGQRLNFLTPLGKCGDATPDGFATQREAGRLLREIQ
eukprot:8932230-Lingulodinium_polyedra.AAC.1